MKLDRRQFLQQATLVLGGALTASCVSAVLDHDPDLPLSTDKSLLDASQKSTVSAVIDRILPTTDTPGAIDVGVPDFVEFMLAEGYHDAQSAIFIAGLARIDSLSEERHATRFALATSSQQDEILHEIEAEELAASGGPFAALFAAGQDRAFFSLSKELTIVGYYTSEMVVKNQFSFSHAAGYYDPCVELKPGDKPWYGGL